VFISFALFLVRYFRVWFLYKNLKKTLKVQKPKTRKTFLKAGFSSPGQSFRR